MYSISPVSLAARRRDQVASICARTGMIRKLRWVSVRQASMISSGGAGRVLVEMNVSNFRSLVEARITFDANYTCVIGAHNAGKSNLIAAYKWLIYPSSLSAGGKLPSVDLSRTATSRTVTLSATLTLAKGAEPDFGFPIIYEGHVHVRRDYVFEGIELPNGQMELKSDSAAPTPVHVLRPVMGAQPEWYRLDAAQALLPRLIHIRPSDIGQSPPGLTLAEGDLLALKWPAELADADLKWVNDSIGSILPPEPGKMPNQVVVDPGSSVMAVWDEYGYPVPLRKAGTGIRQLVYSLAVIALARRRKQKFDALQPPPLIAIDEPEQHLSSGIQKAYAAFLRCLASEHQIVVTSHSGAFLDLRRPSSTCLLVRDHRNGTAQVQEPAATPEIIRRVLGISIDDSLYLGTVTVVVEGESDALLLANVLRARAATGLAGPRSDEVTIVQRGGASKVPAFASLVQQLGLPLLVVLDNDRDGRQAEAIIRMEPWGSCGQVLLLPTPNPEAETEIEDLLPRRTLITAVCQYVREHYSTELVEADFDAAQADKPWLRGKKWGQYLAEVLRKKGLLSAGQHVDDYIQKTAVIQTVLDSIGQLSADNVHPFLWDGIPKALDALIGDFAKQGRPVEGGVVVNTRAYSWVHPANLGSGLDHDS